MISLPLSFENELTVIGTEFQLSSFLKDLEIGKIKLPIQFNSNLQIVQSKTCAIFTFDTSASVLLEVKSMADQYYQLSFSLESTHSQELECYRWSIDSYSI